MERIPGPDFPTGGLIVGRSGIEDAYRTGRGLVTMRAEVEVTEDTRGRTMLVVTQLPYMVNPDSLMRKIDELVNTGKITGLADAIDQSSGVTMRLEIVLRRDAVPRVVLNQLYKHTQLQDTFGCNMVALVDGVPRTLPLDAFVRHWIHHQVDVIQRRTQYRLRKAEERAHILLGLLKALDRSTRSSTSSVRARRRSTRRSGCRSCSTSTSCRPARSSTCSCAGSPRSSARRSSTSTTSRGASPTSTPSWAARRASDRSSARSSPRSSTSSATSGARGSSPPRARCPRRT